ncbi:helix-turn-helix domain-containing protein [uncultured Zhongshania sp.]|uniref:helix-turn-helix domain-containing protein n=1 Tax=uncultured Zhongshania sp. TaxID=1642288 RepID=UPI0030D7D72A|tara:strand:- start:5081 stop:6241 length:1161 start_codon:yes stop_codon:yes gene_type:complete
MNSSALLALGALALGIFIIPALLLKKDSHKIANRLLAVSLICQMTTAASILFNHLHWLDLRNANFLLIALPSCSVVFLLGYVKKMVSPSYQLKATNLLLLLPFILLVYLLKEGIRIDKNALEGARGGWPPTPLAVFGILLYTLQVIYLAFAERLTRHHNLAIENEFSNKDRIGLRWLRIFICAYLMLVILGLAISLIRLLPGLELWPRSIYYTACIVVIYYFIGFSAVIQPDIFTGHAHRLDGKDDEQRSESNANTGKYETSSLTPALAQSIWQDLQGLMESRAPYLKNDLRLSDLAEMAKIPPNHLSQIINQYADKNFFEFINEYRVAQAIRLLAQQPKAKIITIALESGFNSQSAFYKQFKNSTGYTPKQYMLQTLPSKTKPSA